MKIKRNFVTPYITWTFAVLALSGILMLFHVFDGYTEVVHELSGLLFVIFSIFHIIINWAGLKTHFKKRIFITSFIVIMLLSVFIVFAGKGKGEHNRIIIEKLSKAEISDSFEILDIDYYEVEELLRKNNITVGNSKTIEEIGLKNQISPKEIFEMIVKY